MIFYIAKLAEFHAQMLRINSRIFCFIKKPPHLLAQVVEKVFVQAGVLDVVGGDLLLPLDLHADLEADGAGDRTLVASLLQVVPHVHLARQGPDLECSAKMKKKY